ncbi:hypothetical protein HMPREF0005_03800, partial [Achromobacter xylosoxidans C54]
RGHALAEVVAGHDLAANDAADDGAMGGDLAVLVDGLGGIGGEDLAQRARNRELVVVRGRIGVEAVVDHTDVDARALEGRRVGRAGTGEVGRQPGMPVSLMGTTGAGWGGSGGATGSAGVAGSGG